MDTKPHVLGFSFNPKYYLDFPNDLIMERITPEQLPIGIIFDESIPAKIREEFSQGLVEYYKGPRMFYYNRRLSHETPFDEPIDFRDAYIMKPLLSEVDLTKFYFPIKIKKESLQPYLGKNIVSYNIDGVEYVYFILYRIRKERSL